MPLSTCTSRIFTSFTTFLPSHFLQRSFSLITSPGLVRENRSEAGQDLMIHKRDDWLCFDYCAPYLRRYNQCTQTASVGPSLGPAVWSWCASHAPDMLYIFVQHLSFLPACINTEIKLRNSNRINTAIDYTMKETSVGTRAPQYLYNLPITGATQNILAEL